MGKAIAYCRLNELTVAVGITCIAGLQIVAAGRKGRVALKSLGIGTVKHKLNLIGLLKDYLGITDETVLRGERDPVDTSRQLTGAVSLNGHIEAPLMKGINQGLVSIERRLTAGKDDHERV